MLKRLSVLFLVLVAMAVPQVGSAALLDPLIRFPSFPQCDDAKVLGQIVKRFNKAEDNQWKRGFYLEDIRRVRERKVLGEGYENREITDDYHDVPMNEQLIPRRYCRGHAILTNGRHPTLFYLIEGGQGFAGNRFNVEFCVNGLDPWREFDGSCRALNH